MYNWLPILGGLFHNKDDEKAFHLATEIVSSKHFDSPIKLVPLSVITPKHDSYKAFTQTCALLQKGVTGIFGPSLIHSSPYIQTLLDRKEIPHIETHWDRTLLRHNLLLNLHPHPSILIQSYLDIVQAWEWKSLVVIYDTEESLSRMNAFVNLFFNRVSLRRLDLDEDGTYRRALTEIKKTGEKNFLLDCSSEILEDVLKQCQQVGMMTERHSYIITNLDLQTIDLGAFQYSGTNITGVGFLKFQ